MVARPVKKSAGPATCSWRSFFMISVIVGLLLGLVLSGGRSGTCLADRDWCLGEHPADSVRAPGQLMTSREAGSLRVEVHEPRRARRSALGDPGSAV